MSLTFPRLELQHVDLVHGWLDAPHALRWFDGPHTRDEVLHDWFGEGAAGVAAHLAVVDGVPVGLFQWEPFGGYPALMQAYGVRDPRAVNCDVLLAPGASARGHGAALLRAFLKDVVFVDPRVTTCILDPEPENAIAIRCYEKAGFRFVRTAPDDGEGHAAYLMELDRDELVNEPVPAVRYLRPGRPSELALASAIDDDACRAYAEIGLPVLLGPEHPFVMGELARWEAAVNEGFLFACERGEPVGFAIFGQVDERPFLHQIDVLRDHAGKGIGTMLLERVQRWSARAGELWLTTYDAVPWNRPWYERHGFVVIPEHECSATVRGYLAAERAALPRPEARVVMQWRPAR
jgi:GNAT superfamily N-acetyltransferase